MAALFFQRDKKKKINQYEVKFVQSWMIYTFDTHTHTEQSAWIHSRKKAINYSSFVNIINLQGFRNEECIFSLEYSIEIS